MSAVPMSTREGQRVLEVTGVDKSYGRIKALDAVDLRVDAGEFVALLGPNGAGKTTLFQLLSGLFVADAGTILIHGTDIRRQPTAALAYLGIVFQQPTLDLDLSVQANLQFHARLQGMERRRAKQRIGEELERLGLAEDARRSARDLSGGNRRKVELARALLHEPRILLMDEATVGLDPKSRQSLLDYVHHLCTERGLGVLWATHLVDEAERADRILILNKGRVLQAQRPAELLRASGKTTIADAFLALTG